LKFVKKSAFALALLFVLLLPLQAAAGSTAKIYGDDSVAHRVTAVIYCLSDDYNRLSPEVRTFSVLCGQSLAEALTDQVLRDAEKKDNISALPVRSDLKLLSAVITGNIATVNLGGDKELLENYELFCLKAAITNTLIEAGEANYVNVLLNGREVTTNGLPTGTMTHFDEDLQSAWIAHENEGDAALRSQSYSFTRFVTLYFAAQNDSLVLAEVRRITMNRTNLAIPVISAVLAGPNDSATMTRTYPSASKVLGVPDRDEEDERIIDINLSYQMSLIASGTPEERRLCLAPLVLTLTTFLPDLSALRLHVNGRLVQPLYNRGEINDYLLYGSEFQGMIGTTVSLYYPVGDGRQVQVTQAVSQQKKTLRDLIEELMAVPSDMDVQPVFPDGFSSAHIIGIFQTDDTAVVNLTQEGASLLRQMSDDRVRDCIYCIVNTLTDVHGISRVQFLTEGNRINERFGDISLGNPLVRSSGVIRILPD